MKTYFAPAERNTASELNHKIDIVNQSSLMKVFLNSVSGLLAVLDENRQIVSVNDAYLKALGIESAELILGLRPGESVNCVHSRELPGGCGTTRYCKTCGAAVAITVSLAENRPVERECAIVVLAEGTKRDLHLNVKCEPVVLENTRFLLLFLYDTTMDQQRKMLERAFFHDFSNMVGGLATANYLLSKGVYNDKVRESVNTATQMLIKEIEIQRCLMNNDLDYYQASFNPLSPESLFSKLDSLFRRRADSENKTLQFGRSETVREIKSDESLLIRILSNMISNAFEATEKGGRITLYAEPEGNTVKLAVRNDGFIPEEVQLKIFQRNFSTKKGSGRGIGTYSMKLFGEQILGGHVGFSSDRTEGTEFYLKLPFRNISN